MSRPLVIPRLLKMRIHRYFLSYFPRKAPHCNVPLTVVMPLALKDVYRAGISIASIRKHVKHPISDIVIVGQDHDDIRAFCAHNQLTYINEKNVLPITVVESNSGIKPINFVLQQLIKLSVFDFLKADNILVHDSDTYILRDMIFFSGDRQILYLADEYTKSYERLLFDFLGPIKRHHRSFVTHSMLFQRSYFAELEKKVRETLGMSLIEAILSKMEIANAGGLSEFEIYGNFMNHFHSDARALRYWYNKKIPPDTKQPLEQLEARFWNMNTVSAHEH